MLLIFVALQPLSSIARIHTHSPTLPYPSCGYASRHENGTTYFCKMHLYFSLLILAIITSHIDPDKPPKGGSTWSKGH